jgi:hypothetical protein
MIPYKIYFSWCSCSFTLFTSFKFSPKWLISLIFTSFKEACEIKPHFLKIIPINPVPKYFEFLFHFMITIFGILTDCHIHFQNILCNLWIFLFPNNLHVLDISQKSLLLLILKFKLNYIKRVMIITLRARSMNFKSIS